MCWIIANSGLCLLKGGMTSRLISRISVSACLRVYLFWAEDFIDQSVHHESGNTGSIITLCAIMLRLGGGYVYQFFIFSANRKTVP